MKIKLLPVYLIVCLLPLYACSSDANSESCIRLNQIGFYTNQQKIAVIVGASPDSFSVCLFDSKKKVYAGKLFESVKPSLNGNKTFIADFSALTQPGKYLIYIKSLGYSYPFRIQAKVYNEVAQGAAKAFYYQRASAALVKQFAGKWARPAGHPDTKVFIHSSAASASRPAGTSIVAAGGWYDAGDYNKYIVNSGITMGTLLSLYEDFPEFTKSFNLNIPEADNQTPDLLDEAIYNLRWMLKMQDPEDGGVYNKLTNAGFDGMVMPHITQDARYVVQKGTAATLDFSAVTAQAARLLKPYSKNYPGLADSCLLASKNAWNWARRKPSIAYNQEEMNRRFEPQITTGGYGDRTFTDEFIWAACELYLSTGDTAFYRAVDLIPDEKMPVPSWGNVRLLGYYSLLRNKAKLQTDNVVTLIEDRLVKTADGLLSGVHDRAYKTVIGRSGGDFGWGSNSLAANQGIALIQAYKLKKERKYLDAALSNLDYLLGRNATGYCYITGYGTRYPMNPHHRPSAADGITEPVPGLLVGGPNPGRQDRVALPSLVSDEAYIDNVDSYATNEIAINWQAPLVYLVAAAEALQFKSGYSPLSK